MRTFRSGNPVQKSRLGCSELGTLTVAEVSIAERIDRSTLATRPVNQCPFWSELGPISVQTPFE